MLTSDSIETIAKIFSGDIPNYYTYKSGGYLVKFFNQYFGYRETYGSGFPTRWQYVHDKLVDLFNNNKLDNFFTLILSKTYIMKDLNCNEIEAVTKIVAIVEEFNRILKLDECILIEKNGQYKLDNINSNLIYLGSGGFADVYKIKSTGLVQKKLKEEFISDSSIRSRFKREYEITKSLENNYGIVKVFNFDNEICAYTMEEAETIFDDYVAQGLNDEIKIKCIRTILLIMKDIHNRDIIHRDISPNNIFIINGQIKIADFGLGKDLNVLTSHQTLLTNQVGQYLYCAPEQFMLLKDGDKRSDVFSLGRLINFIMTGSPTNKGHFLRLVTEKATNENSSFRYADAGELLKYVEKSIEFHEKEYNKEEILKKMKLGDFNIDVENYLYEINGDILCNEIIEFDSSNYRESLYKFMNTDDSHAQYLIELIFYNYQNVCLSWESYDPFAYFAYHVVVGKYPFIVKELSAKILNYIAWSINRFNVQQIIETIYDEGVEPILEEMLRG